MYVALYLLGAWKVLVGGGRGGLHKNSGFSPGKVSGMGVTYNQFGDMSLYPCCSSTFCHKVKFIRMRKRSIVRCYWDKESRDFQLIKLPYSGENWQGL